MDCIETAMFKDQTQEEKERLLHMVSGHPNPVRFRGEFIDLQFPRLLLVGVQPVLSSLPNSRISLRMTSRNGFRELPVTSMLPWLKLFRT